MSLDLQMSRVFDLGRVGSCASDELAIPRQRAGKDFVPISGSPRIEPPQHVLEAAMGAMKATGYAPRRGAPALQKAVADRIERKTGVVVDPETQVVVSNGAMQALHIIMTAMLEPGDEVIIPIPSFSYEGLVQLAGGTPVPVEMPAEDDYAWDFDRLEAAVTPRSRMIIVNTPVNPTGRVLTRDELARLVRFAEAHDLLIVADEAYDRLIYDHNEHVCPYGIEGAAERTILVQSATKTFAMGAWRVGWIVSTPEYTNAFARMIEWMMLACGQISQAAVAAAITGPRDWLASMASDFQANRDLAIEALSTFDGVSYVVPQGGPFLLPDVSSTGLSGDDFAELLIQEYGLRVSGGSYYGAPRSIRVPFGGTPEAVRTTFERIEDALRRVRS
jgi:aspartate/methionine/tyrosine aminotransferase